MEVLIFNQRSEYLRTSDAATCVQSLGMEDREVDVVESLENSNLFDRVRDLIQQQLRKPDTADSQI
jgi:hypothetical protein